MRGKFSRTVEASTPEVPAEKVDGGPLHFPDLFRGNGKAEVSATMGYAFAYGKGKCSVTVTLSCDQEAAIIDLAADMALRKADMLAQEGMKIAEEYLRAQGAWEG
jgi:hypothetical protein